ncbi:MAG: AAA family ATPase [Bythopirellula sp.]|nr:AAA family ATPase [Bythopirellula sp.]
MEAVILIGIQASGKSTFCKERLFNTHVRINLDMLRTRHREQLLLAACIEAKQPFVIDNTNPTKEDRTSYIKTARASGFRIVGYYFASKLENCKKRNDLRVADQVVPLVGLLGTYGKLQLPDWNEGYDELYYVTFSDNSTFTVSEWSDEI